MEFFGTYYLSVDENGLIELPEVIRSYFGDGDALLRFSFERTSVECISETQDALRQSALGHAPAASGETSFCFADPIRVSLRDDAFIIPSDVCEELGIVDEVVLVGADDALWIWNPAAWEREQQDIGIEELLGVSS